MAEFTVPYILSHLVFVFVFVLWLFLGVGLQLDKNYTQKKMSFLSGLVFGFVMLFSWKAYFKVYMPLLLPETKAIVDNEVVGLVLDLISEILHYIVIPVLAYKAYECRHIVGQLRQRILAVV